MNDKCSARTAPPNLWLPDEISRQLGAARLPGKGRDAWYKLFGLLFPEMEEGGPAGYRALYTPCKSSIWGTGRSQDTDMLASLDYSNAQTPLPARLPNGYGTASPSRPNLSSILTPSSNSANPARLTPLGGDGNAMLSNLALTDSGYASAFHPLLPDTQLGCVDEKALPSSDGEGDEGVEDDEAKTTYSAATTVSQADARHYISELSHEIAKRLSIDVDVKLASVRCALPELIKRFSVNLGLESASQINRDIMYFVHKHHR